MSIILFAIIGSIINPPAWYWVCFGVYSVLRVAKAVWEVAKNDE